MKSPPLRPPQGPQSTTTLLVRAGCDGFFELFSRSRQGQLPVSEPRSLPPDQTRRVRAADGVQTPTSSFAIPRSQCQLRAPAHRLFEHRHSGSVGRLKSGKPDRAPPTKPGRHSRCAPFTAPLRRALLTSPDFGLQTMTLLERRVAAALLLSWSTRQRRSELGGPPQPAL